MVLWRFFGPGGSIRQLHQIKEGNSQAVMWAIFCDHNWGMGRRGHIMWGIVACDAFVSPWRGF